MAQKKRVSELYVKAKTKLTQAALGNLNIITTIKLAITAISIRKLHTTNPLTNYTYYYNEYSSSASDYANL